MWLAKVKMFEEWVVYQIYESTPPKQKVTYFLMIKHIFKKMSKNIPINYEKLNMDIVFKLAWASFLYLGEITYIETKLKKARFLVTKVT